MPRVLAPDIITKVKWYLRERKFLSDREIARQCHVSAPYVHDVRKRMTLPERVQQLIRPGMKMHPVPFDGTVREWRERCKNDSKE